MADVLPFEVARNAREENGNGKGDQGQHSWVLLTPSFQGLPVTDQPTSFQGKEETEEGDEADQDKWWRHHLRFPDQDGRLPQLGQK